MYVVRLALFDCASAVLSRKAQRLDESGLSLDTNTGLPLELDGQARAIDQTIPSSLFEDLSNPVSHLAPPTRTLDPAARVFTPDTESCDRIKPLFEPLRPLDYRFGAITIQWQDMRPGGVAGEQAKEVKAKGTIDVGFGLVHLYRDAKVSSEECTILAVLAIPPIMSVEDFLAFVQPGAESISQIRMIKDAMPNRCMALLKFREAEDAALFHEEYDGKPFWAMLDDEICHIVRVRSVEVSASTAPPFTFPVDEGPLVSGPGGLIELPTCPVCLERMDSSVTGLATILCSHTYHIDCLSKWAGGNGKCPVCRYSQTRSVKPAEEPSMATTCDVCGAGAAGESLWMCLLCGHVGCGRYQGGHAAAHYEATQHLYAIELESQRVWDYGNDEFVHRYIQNKTDGKLVELPSRHPEPDGGGGPNRAARQAQEKAEAVGLEYQQLLSSQLASQRAYYSDMVAQLKEEMAAVEIKAKDEAAKLEIKAKRAEKAVEITRTLQKELASEREMTKGLLANLQQMREENRKAREETAGVKSEVAELQEQLRDLMFALSARDKIEASGSELAGGAVSVPPQNTPPQRRNRKR